MSLSHQHLKRYSTACCDCQTFWDSNTIGCVFFHHSTLAANLAADHQGPARIKCQRHPNMAIYCGQKMVTDFTHVYIFYHIFTCKICNVIACWDFSFSTWGAGVGTYSWYVILVKSGASCRLLRWVRSLLLRLNVGSCHRNCSGMPWRKFRNKSEWFQQSWWQNRCGLRVIDACLT